jgi:hypothetical protein
MFQADEMPPKANGTTRRAGSQRIPDILKALPTRNGAWRRLGAICERQSPLDRGYRMDNNTPLQRI